MTFQNSVHVIELCNPEMKKNALPKQIDYLKSTIRVTYFFYMFKYVYKYEKIPKKYIQ